MWLPAVALCANLHLACFSLLIRWQPHPLSFVSVAFAVIGLSCSLLVLLPGLRRVLQRKATAINAPSRGRGYSFGGGGDGVYRTDPQERAQKRNCKAVIRLGYTNLPSWEVERIVKWMENTNWGADSYHPLTHNCNCLCKQLARFLGLSVPSWVNRAARWAAPFAPLIVVEGGVAT